VVVSDPHFREETAAGTPMPWHYALILLAAWLAADFADRPARPGPAWGLGVVLGLLALTRFDQALFVAGLGFGLTVVAARRAGPTTGLKAAARVAVAAGLVLAPWLVRNVAVFGTPWAVDNAVTVASTDPHTVILCAYEGNRPPSWRDDPRLWVGQRVGYALRNLARWNAGFLAAPLVGLTGALLVARWGRLPVRTRAAVIVLGWNVAASWAGLSLTPFEHERYYSPWYAFTLVAALILVDHLLPDAGWRPAGMGLAAAAVFAATAGYEPFRAAIARPDWRWRMVPGSPAAQAEAFRATITAGRIGTARPLSRLVAVEFDWDRQPDFHAEAYHALTGVPTIHLPFHVAGDGPAFREWLHRWRPDYLLTTHEWARRMGFGPFVVADAGVGRVLIDAGRIE
jgi:4-amino-4-deoxy-L-arabinose transferase-like glycosyltransferase